MSDVPEPPPSPPSAGAGRLPRWRGEDTRGWTPGRAATPTWLVLAALLGPPALAGPTLITGHSAVFGVVLLVFAVALLAASAMSRWDLFGAVIGGLVLLVVVWLIWFTIDWQHAQHNDMARRPAASARVPTS